MRFQVRTHIVRCGDPTPIPDGELPGDLVALVRCGNSGCESAGAVWFARLADILHSTLACSPILSPCCDRPWMPVGLGAISLVSLDEWHETADGEDGMPHFHIASAIPVPMLEEEAA